jgi:hypothetical protein
MINITLKVKHFYFIVDMLSTFPASYYFKLLNQIKLVTEGKDYEDYATVQSTVSEIEKIYSYLASKPEGQVNEINTEMNQIFLSTMTDMIQQGSAEWADLSVKIEAIRQQNWGVTQSAIQRGEDFLNSNY